MDFLFNLSPIEIMTLSNLLSVNMADDYTITELAIIANFFMVLGENLETVLRVRANDEYLQTKAKANGQSENFDVTDQ